MPSPAFTKSVDGNMPGKIFYWGTDSGFYWSFSSQNSCLNIGTRQSGNCSFEIDIFQTARENERKKHRASVHLIEMNHHFTIYPVYVKQMMFDTFYSLISLKLNWGNWVCLSFHRSFQIKVLGLIRTRLHD